MQTSIRKKVANIIPVDEEFRKAFETASVSKAQFARYYLRCLEMAAKGEPTPWFIPNDHQGYSSYDLKALLGKDKEVED